MSRCQRRVARHDLVQETRAAGVLRRRLRERRVVLFLEHQILLAVLLLDRRQGVHVFFESLASGLPLGRMGQPCFVVFHELVIGHATVMGQHVLSHRLQREVGGHLGSSQNIVFFGSLVFHTLALQKVEIFRLF